MAVPNRTPEHIRKEEQRRQPVFTHKPKTILVKVLAMGALPGVPKKVRDNTTVEIRHILEAEDKGLDPFAIRRERADTGYCLFQKEEGVRAGMLLQQLREQGYCLVGMHWADQNNKGPVNTFEFSKEGAEISLPDAAYRILAHSRFNHCTVWCNLRTNQDGKQFRLDTVNLAKGRRDTQESSRILHMSGNTYRLV